MKFSDHTYYLGALVGSALTAVMSYAADTPSENLAIPAVAAAMWAATWSWNRYLKKGPRGS